MEEEFNFEDGFEPIYTNGGLYDIESIKKQSKIVIAEHYKDLELVEKHIRYSITLTNGNSLDVYKLLEFINKEDNISFLDNKQKQCEMGNFELEEINGDITITFDCTLKFPIYSGVSDDDYSHYYVDILSPNELESKIATYNIEKFLELSSSKYTDEISLIHNTLELKVKSNQIYDFVVF